MRKSKTDMPLIIFDKRVPDTFSFPQEEAGPLSEQEQPLRREEAIPHLEILLQNLFLGLQRLVIAFKHRLLTFVKHNLGEVKVPWFKLMILALAAYALLVKDMQFNIALQAPVGLVGSGQNGGDRGDGGTTYQSDLAPASVAMLQDKGTEAFIKRYAPVAVAEMKKYGIPASIKMGQALIESRAGKSRLAIQSNNHFGIKCKTKCKGCTCRNYADDGAYDMFRVFDNPWESWREHSQLLQIDRYKGLKKYKKDYRKWAKGLKQAGYATDKKYAEKLIFLIESLDLMRFDQ